MITLNEYARGIALLAVAVAMLIGLAGIVLPIAPGLILIWLAAVVYGLVQGMTAWGWFYFVLITVLCAGGYAFSSLAAQLGAAKTGVSWQANGAGCLLGIAGFFLVPVIGSIAGAALGIFLVEYVRLRAARAAWKATSGALLGFLLGYGVQLIAGCLMICCWLLWVAQESLHLL